MGSISDELPVLCLQDICVLLWEVLVKHCPPRCPTTDDMWYLLAVSSRNVLVVDFWWRVWQLELLEPSYFFHFCGFLNPRKGLWERKKLESRPEVHCLTVLTSVSELWLISWCEALILSSSLWRSLFFCSSTWSSALNLSWLSPCAICSCAYCFSTVVFCCFCFTRSLLSDFHDISLITESYLIVGDTDPIQFFLKKLVLVLLCLEVSLIFLLIDYMGSFELFIIFMKVLFLLLPGVISHLSSSLCLAERYIIAVLSQKLQLSGGFFAPCFLGFFFWPFLALFIDW